MPDFIPGLALSEQFYHEAVRPILEAASPGLPHSAALIGSGSEVLGFGSCRRSSGATRRGIPSRAPTHRSASTGSRC